MWVPSRCGCQDSWSKSLNFADLHLFPGVSLKYFKSFRLFKGIFLLSDLSIIQTSWMHAPRNKQNYISREIFSAERKHDPLIRNKSESWENVNTCLEQNFNEKFTQYRALINVNFKWHLKFFLRSMLKLMKTHESSVIKSEFWAARRICHSNKLLVS